MNDNVEKKLLGFAAMSKEKIVELARKGGQVAHATGKRYCFNRESAIRAAEIGAEKRRQARAAKEAAQLVDQVCSVVDGVAEPITVV